MLPNVGASISRQPRAILAGSGAAPAPVDRFQGRAEVSLAAWPRHRSKAAAVVVPGAKARTPVLRGCGGAPQAMGFRGERSLPIAAKPRNAQRHTLRSAGM